MQGRVLFDCVVELNYQQCDGRGATAHERHIPAPYLQLLAHTRICIHIHTQTHKDAHTGLHEVQQSRPGHQSWFLPFIRVN